ncbi:hypothetical protein [Bacillus sp. S/N-304-OC-R1]|uniref:hypothetical protein n=1 Tax=Bacillus sp. S/N-304-OC-R1 TaxID=2758034 RepID=UPI001C8D1E0C|nr:hypothetical protein [Bacillus sp. S/N-304-OC-R1]MBY0122190.1 hypothetical protein [Bacillus sp. S/N-304-OC-R1]
MFETKSGVIYEPTTSVSQSVFDWLKNHQSTLEGSRAYEDMKEIYETLEYDFGQKEKLVG